MARTMKAVTAKPSRDNVLVIEVDPLKVGRGPRLIQRGGLHGSGKRPSRAKSKRQWRRESAESRRGAPDGQLV